MMRRTEYLDAKAIRDHCKATGDDPPGIVGLLMMIHRHERGEKVVARFERGVGFRPDTDAAL